jgi:signal transduction histidine kinase
VLEGVSEPDPETLRTMLTQTRRLGRLVTQLLDLSRLEAGEQPFDIRPFVVRDVLENAAREARLHAPESVVFSIDAPAGLRAAGDADRIHQVVMNLLDNAARYSPQPGHVALRASSGEHTITLEVEDEGPGIPEGELERVFERFYRGDGRDSDGGGAGLGLAIARWIVELHGGTIRAERREPHGSHMVFTLPQARS